MATKTYHGSCHCGAVKFEVDADLATGTFRCNCSICTKNRHWLVGVAPAGLRFKAGEASLRDYQFAGHKIHHLFCPTCGIKVAGKSSDGKGAVVNVAALDDATPQELAAAQIKYFDGRHDRFDREPEVKSYL
jgi:hypothetical protein